MEEIESSSVGLENTLDSWSVSLSVFRKKSQTNLGGNSKKGSSTGLEGTPDISDGVSLLIFKKKSQKIRKKSKKHLGQIRKDLRNPR